METRRLAILSSHLCPSCSGPVPARSSKASASGCWSQRQSVLDFKEETFRRDSVFCQIIRGDSPALKLYEDDMCLCKLDTSPLSRGIQVVAAMCSKLPFIGNAIMKATGSDSFNFLVNNGAAAGQVIFHSLHWCPLNLDQETSGLANRVLELLLSISEESKDQMSSLS